MHPRQVTEVPDTEPGAAALGDPTVGTAAAAFAWFEPGLVGALLDAGRAALDRDDVWGWVLGGVAVLGAGLTAFYMTRLFVLTFHGPARWTDDIKEPHESPLIMTVPLILFILPVLFLTVLGRTVLNVMKM